MLVAEQTASPRPAQLPSRVYRETHSSSRLERIVRVDDLIKLINSLSGGQECWSEEQEAEKRAFDFMERLYALCKLGERGEAIARALDFFDDLLIDGRFFECGRALGLLNPKKLAPSVIVSVLGITIRAKQVLGTARASFYQLGLQEVTRLKGKKYANELLGKYR
jgi:hypothetical protein